MGGRLAAAAGHRGARLAVLLSLAGALAAPLAWMAVTGLALLALAGAGIGGWLIARPPADFRAAGWRLALGLALLFLLAPASRVGYFVYPLGLAAFLVLTRWPGLLGENSVNPEPQRRRPAVQVHH